MNDFIRLKLKKIDNLPDNVKTDELNYKSKNL